MRFTIPGMLFSLCCAALSPLVAADVAHACSVLGPETPTEIIPGLRAVNPQVGDAGSGLPLVPRNVAVFPRLHVDDTPSVVADGTIVALRSLPAPIAGITFFQSLHTAVDPLPVGAEIQADPSAAPVAVVGDYTDTTAPEQLRVARGHLSVSSSGCGEESSCDDIAFIDVELDPPSDDHTPSDNLVYAVFLGGTAAEVRDAAEPTQILLTTGGAISLPRTVNPERNLFITIVAIDFAGNVSARSNPFQVHKADGCAIAQVDRASLTTWGLVALVVIGVTRHRRGNRRRDLSNRLIG